MPDTPLPIIPEPGAGGTPTAPGTIITEPGGGSPPAAPGSIMPPASAGTPPVAPQTVVPQSPPTPPVWNETLRSYDGIPPSAAGTNGMYAVNINDGVIYKKENGSWVVAHEPTNNEVYFVTALPSNATGSNGDLAVIYIGGVISGLASKAGGVWTQIATNAVTTPKPTDGNVISFVEHFLGGNTITTATGVVGDSNIYFKQTVGSTGFAKPDQTNHNSCPSAGVYLLRTGSNTGDCVTLSWYNGGVSGNTMDLNRFTRLTDFRLHFQFKVDTNGDFYFGLSNNPTNGNSAPTRFVGVKAISGTTNFQFEATNGSPTTVDSGVAVDSGWHSFDLTYDGNDWGMSLDGAAPVTVARVLSTSLTVTLGAWVKTNSPAYQNAFIDTIKLFGITP